MLIAHLQCCGTKSVKNCVSRSSKWKEREDQILHLKHRGMCLCVSHGFTWKLYPYQPLTAYDDDNDDNDDEHSNNKALSSNSLYHSGWEYLLRNEWYSSNEWCIPYAMLTPLIDGVMAHSQHEYTSSCFHEVKALNMLVDMPYGFYFEQCVPSFSPFFASSIISHHSYLCLVIDFLGRLSFSAVMFLFFPISSPFGLILHSSQPLEIQLFVIIDSRQLISLTR